jgi:SAM-dependent methyltransferase
MPRERDDLSHWVHQFDDAFWLSQKSGGEDEAEFVKKALHLRSGQSVLDCPCGSGRVSVPLAKMGLQVTGIDFKPEFIRFARQEVGSHGSGGNFIAMDMREIAFEGRFHAAFNWRGSFGYFSDVENALVLHRLARSLRPGGRLLIDQPNRESLLRHFQRVVHGEIEIRNRWDRPAQRVYSTWTTTRKGKRLSSKMSIRLHTPAQLRDMFASEGLGIEAAFGGYKGQPFGRASKRMIMIGRKPLHADESARRGKTQRALALLQMLAMGERDIAAGRVTPQDEVFDRLLKELEARKKAAKPD